MKIRRVKAADFGKLNGSLELADGMTVIHGANEAGKTSWLQATFAGLCGRRRGKGRTTEETAFAERFEPWNGRPWRAGALIALEDGTQIELDYDLNEAEGTAEKTTTRQSVANDILYDGSPDGARFLGLNRHVLPSTILIGQGDILRLRQKKAGAKPGKEEAALKKELQLAAASAGRESTAVEALARLEKYRGEHIGTERAPRKPLRKAMERTRVARDRLNEGREQHKERAQLEHRLEAAASGAKDAQQRVDHLQRVQDRRQLKKLSESLAEIDQLAPMFPSGEPPPEPGKTPDAEAADELREAAADYRARPDEPEETEGESADELERQLTLLPETPSGDSVVDPSVAEAESGWKTAKETRQVREGLGPGDAPSAAVAAEYRPAVERCLAALQQAARAAERDRREEAVTGGGAGRSAGETARMAGSYRRWSQIIGLGGTSLAALALLFFDAYPQGLAFLGLCLGLGLGLYVIARKLSAGQSTASARRPDPEIEETGTARSGDAAGATEAVRSELAALGLPADAETLGRALRDLDARARWESDHARWQEQLGNAKRAEIQAEARLRTALAARGTDDPAKPASQVFAEYEAACRENARLADRSARRSELKGQVEDRRKRELMAAAQRARRAAAENRFRAALAAFGFADDATEDPEKWAARRLKERDERLRTERRNWERLQYLLDGRDRDLLAAERDAIADRLDAPGAADEAAADQAADEAASSLSGIELDRESNAARRQAADAAKDANILEGKLQEQRLPELAELEEERDAAEQELETLRRAAEIVELTREHLEAARNEVHELLALKLQKSLEERLGQVTGSRYTAASIDPQANLEVKLQVEDGKWRSASQLSQGTVDQVYLLLRIGLAEALGNTTETAPLFLDDSTVHCDADRTRRFLDLLLQLSDERQIVVFSQEEEVRAWAERRFQGCVRHRLIELDQHGQPSLPAAKAVRGARTTA